MQSILGRHAVMEALLNEADIDRIVVAHQSSKSADVVKILKTAKRNRIKTQVLSKNDFERQVKDGKAQGVAAFLRSWKNADLDSILENPDQFPLIVALDHLEDPYNMGAIIRSCAAFGVQAVIYPKDRQCQLSPGVIKTASGGIHHLELVKIINLHQALTKLKNKGYWLYSTDVNGGSSIAETAVNRPAVIVMGNEQKGVSDNINKLVDDKLHIPMIGAMESLNVSVSAGILLYAIQQHHA